MTRNLLLVGLVWFVALFAGRASAEITYIHTDVLGSPVAETNSSGGFVKFHYKPFGETLEAKRNDVGYTGHMEDKELGLTYMQARYYDPVIGRFYSNDPVGFNNVHNFNRYAYGNNNPYKYIDPDGNNASIAIDIGIRIATNPNTPRAAAALGVRLAGAGATAMADSPLPGPADVVAAAVAVVAIADFAVETLSTPNFVEQRGNPPTGEPGTWAEHPHGKQDRLYGPDGKPAVDIDYGHDHGQGSPHAHNWDKGERQAGVPVSKLPEKEQQEPQEKEQQ